MWNFNICSLAPTLLLLWQPLLTNAAENDTAPPDSTEVIGWQADAPRRGTLHIIINCIFTILACTWSIQHLNVPSHDELQPSKWGWPRIRWILHPFQPLNLTWAKVKWTGMTILFPELVLAHSVAEFQMALESMQAMGSNGLRMPVQYPKSLRRVLSNKFSTNMGNEQAKLGKKGIPKQWQWTIVHSYYANMGGFHLYATREDLTPPIKDALEACFGVAKSKLDDDSGGQEEAIDICCLTTDQLIYCLEHFEDFKFEDVWISREEIEDKGKAENFAKLIAVLELANLVLSICVRWGRRFAVSQLEVLTVVFAICGVVIYVFRWYKPKGVEIPTRVWLQTDNNSGQDPLEERLKVYGPDLRLRSPDRIYEVLKQPNDGRIPTVSGKIRNDNVPRRQWNESHYIVHVLAGLTVAIGCLHLIAWDFEYPTFCEKILWRVSCFSLIILPLAPVFVLPVVRKAVWKRATKSFFVRFLELAMQPPEHLTPGPLALRLQGLNRFFLDQIGLDFYSNILDYPDGYDKETKKYLEEHLEEAPRLEKVMKGKVARNYVDFADHITKFPTLEFGLWAVLFYASFFLYTAARLIMIGLAFSTLRAMPDTLYKTTWVDFIPNVT
ncbi:hypothetical protein CC78DRAFT_593531 [Lojkania enalia]|uniref:Uncharacterized protein n=1 Tax=Lojkania enalia TaxID=147567 RepID=A0A9P4JXS2_9PLEO|nr:hypothetical protein CC78DRAFT_593531 [Didymosphaeria enalia]